MDNHHSKDDNCIADFDGQSKVDIVQPTLSLPLVFHFPNSMHWKLYFVFLRNRVIK